MSTEAAARGGEAARPLLYPALHAAGEAEGFTRGHAAGYAAGLRKAEAQARILRAELDARHHAAVEEGRERLAQSLALLETAARALHARTAPVLAEADAGLAAAALALAGAVIGRELSDAQAGAKAALGRALSAPAAGTAIAIRLHPEDLALLEAEGATTEGTALVPDPTLGRGDAVVDYPDGELDARIGSALARAAAALSGEDA
ncbi:MULTISPECIES: FliH/SctL family protein [Arthrobacter]|uniref:FliH/SctL family protein n=2 Tax=Arthrobacter TaxID=1663 RepID=A0ABU9KKG2_9MICC|nr:FliH/SctL family protein [Arthrobacter sp. YJM1]MDP5226342.1 FliH/SctL family protein [Arthrobacter sp. YJM1]